MKNTVRTIMSKYTDNPKCYADILNNFHNYLPLGWEREMAETGNMHLGKTYIDKTPEQAFGEHTKNYSYHFRTKTYRHFFETIDTILHELGIYNKVVELQQEKNKTRETFNIVEKLYKLTIPAYRKLRQMRYTQHDLTA